MKGFFLLCFIFLMSSCKHVKQNDDTLYSKHLQRNVKLHILHTPPPSDRSLFNLLILNDGQDMDKLRVKETMDSFIKQEKYYLWSLSVWKQATECRNMVWPTNQIILAAAAKQDFMMHSSTMNYILMQKKNPESENFNL